MVAVYTWILLDDLIARFTYAGIFLVLFVAGLGAPIPEELPILAAGVLSSQDIVRWWAALGVCLVGVLAGDTALYWVGHHWGDHILEWRITRRVLTREREEVMKRAPPSSPWSCSPPSSATPPIARAAKRDGARIILA